MYRKAAKNAYRFAKVAFAFDILCRVSHYRHHRLYQTEAETILFFFDDRVQRYHLSAVGFAFAFPLYPNLILYPGLEDIFDPVIRVALPLYRCYLSSKNAFPSSDLTEEWIADVLRNAHKRIDGDPGPSPPAEMASPVFYQR
jgi:hypothetical protein